MAVLKPHVRWRWWCAREAWSIEFEGMLPVSIPEECARMMTSTDAEGGEFDELVLGLAAGSDLFDAYRRSGRPKRLAAAGLNAGLQIVRSPVEL